MCDPLEAQSHLDDFFNLVPDVRVNEFRNVNFKVRLLESPSTGNVLPTLKWRSGGQPASHLPLLPSIEVAELHRRPASAIRIIFPGVDEPDRNNLLGLKEIFERFSVPSVFLKERVVGVTNSFGIRDTNHNTQDSWLHFLCKNVVLTLTANGDPNICGPGPQHHLAAGGPSWIQGGFFMKWNKTGGHIFLCCFGSFPRIEERLRRFIENTDNVQSALYDPYTLYVIILDELHSKMDSVVWDLISVFNRQEEQIFKYADAQHERLTEYKVDFVLLHNLEKIAIHLKEGCDAIADTAKAIQKAHGGTFNPSHFRDLAPHPAISSTEKDLEYMLSAFNSLSLRVRSVETRVKNVINLAFNLVTQRDSIILQHDSHSMKTIAIMTMIFLPLTAVASIFGTQFFNADFSDNGKGKLKVSGDFWLLWLLGLPATAITMLAWYFWFGTGSARLHFQKHLA